MNRELQRRNSRRTMSRKIGGGYGMGAPLVTIPSGPGSDWNFAVKQPINQGFDDCLFPARPGELFNTPQPAVAQAGWPSLGGAGGGMMVGGKRSRRQRSRKGRKQRGGVESNNESVNMEIEMLNESENENTKNIVNEPMAESENESPVNMNGGGYDSIETSHAYRPNGWDQTLRHGASSATEWGRDTGLVQTVMAGGRRYKSKGGAIDPIEASHAYPPNGWETPSTHGAPLPTWGVKTGLAQESMVGGRKRRGTRQGTRRMRGGGCGCAGSKLFGGSRKRRAGRGTRRMRGGASNGYAVDPSVSVGGSGPNVAPLHSGVPCDPRAGSMNPNNPTAPMDPRAYGVGYSATPNTTLPSLQAGGAYSTGNAFPDSCYKAPGSELPVYNAQTAGYNFYPSIARGGTLPDGVTPYNDVVPYAARMGGARRKSRKARGRKGYKGRKGHKGARR